MLLLLALLLGAALYLFDLGGTPVQCGNETMYLLPPVTMLDTGDFLVGHYLHSEALEKPPLTLWIIAASYRLFGVSVAAGRLPGALAGLGTVAVLGLWVRRRSGDRAGILASLCLAFSFKFAAFSREFAADAFLALGVTLAVIALDDAARREDLSDLRAGAQAGAALALAFGFKGLIGVALPAGAVGLGLLLDRSRPVRPFRRAVPLVLVLLAALVPWHWAMTLRMGSEFWRRFYLTNQFLRATTDVLAKRERGPLFYLGVLAWAAFPWVLFVPAALSVRKSRRPSTPAAWLVFGLLFLSVLTMKREVYLMPLLPAVAALAGEYLAAPQASRFGLGRLAWAATLVAAAAALVLWARMAPSLARLVGVPAALALAAGLLLLLASSSASARSPNRPSAALWTALSCGIAFLAVLGVESRLSQYDPLPEWGARVRRLLPQGGEAFRIGMQCTSVEFFTRREWIDLSLPRELVGHVPPAGGFAIVRSAWERELEALGIRAEVIERRPWFESNWAAASLSRRKDPFVSLSFVRLLPVGEEPKAATAAPAGHGP